ISACTRTADLYHWLADDDLGDLAAPLADVRTAAGQVLDEYEKVRALTEQAEEAVEEAAGDVASLVRRARTEPPATADGWIARLAEFRRAQGRLETLRSEEHTSELQSRENLVCRLLLAKKNSRTKT